MLLKKEIIYSGTRGGLEPARYFYRGILGPLCLQFHHSGFLSSIPYLKNCDYTYNKKSINLLEAEAGIEPA